MLRYYPTCLAIKNALDFTWFLMLICILIEPYLLIAVAIEAVAIFWLSKRAYFVGHESALGQKRRETCGFCFEIASFQAGYRDGQKKR